MIQKSLIEGEWRIYTFVGPNNFAIFVGTVTKPVNIHALTAMMACGLSSWKTSVVSNTYLALLLHVAV